MKFSIIDIKQLLVELNKYTFKQLHIHHTWKPAKSNFDGTNHLRLQTGMRNYHMNTNGWGDIAQHVTLAPDGKFVTGRDFGKTPISIKGWNIGAFALEMIGNFDTKGTGQINSAGHDILEGKQKIALMILVSYFYYKYGEESIKFHRDSASAGKTCPGTSLDKAKLIKEALEYTKVAPAKPKPAPAKPAPVKPKPVSVKPKPVVSKPKPAPPKPKLTKISGIRVLGYIQIAFLRNYTYIYSKPSDISERVGKAFLGDKIPIAGSMSDWYEVIHKGKRGYVKVKYAKKV